MTYFGDPILAHTAHPLSCNPGTSMPTAASDKAAEASAAAACPASGTTSSISIVPPRLTLSGALIVEDAREEAKAWALPACCWQHATRAVREK